MSLALSASKAVFQAVFVNHSQSSLSETSVFHSPIIPWTKHSMSAVAYCSAYVKAPRLIIFTMSSNREDLSLLAMQMGAVPIHSYRVSSSVADSKACSVERIKHLHYLMSKNTSSFTGLKIILTYRIMTIRSLPFSTSCKLIVERIICFRTSLIAT